MPALAPSFCESNHAFSYILLWLLVIGAAWNMLRSSRFVCKGGSGISATLIFCPEVYLKTSSHVPAQLLQTLLGGRVMDKAIIALCGIGKMFVGDIIEMGESPSVCLMTHKFGATGSSCYMESPSVLI